MKSAQRSGAIIVGASSGIGAALARELAPRGYALALVARRAAALDALSAEINQRANANIAYAYPHDVRDYSAAPDLYVHITRALEAAGAPVRVLVYVAGIMPPPDNEDSWSFEDERAMLETNTLGAVRWLALGAETFAHSGHG
ncbi:MAG TPA: SDR family NAD(P)-dependent oxidoreductase, partial [Ktedonobacterales bacterium]|nr:SDR family NAD(P)-dependent oxidoreductase [Ktedonobacterales bacterium]